MPEPDVIMPQNNFFLLGQENAEKAVLEAYNNHTLHNSWLISGERGIGKATFAYKFARFLLDPNRSKESLNTSPDSASNRLISSGAHPDLKVIERDYIETDRKKIIKSIKDGEAMGADELQNLKKSAFIRIDEVRAINEFMAKKSSQDGWKVVIVDSVDDMNANAANALLKVLEEPPAQSIILLISHNVERLLPTIKSRCRKLVLKPLSEDVVKSLLRRYRPEMSESEVKGIAHIASGSIGKALAYADGGALEFYEGLQKIVFAGSRFKLDDLLEWVGLAAANEENFALARELVLKFCADNIAGCRNVDDMAAVWEYALRNFRSADSLNMDKKQLLTNIVARLCKVS